jgi:lipopolysaccharide transport system ATP-binding protein
MSMSDVVIRVEGLGKKYALHHESSERYTALRDVLARQARVAGRLLNPFTLAGQLRKAQRQAAAERAESEEEFWALKDVSFEIRRGERVGIIGRNGAGKSTLLKILSRITEPTTGRVEICGRVASLLEVGTGFHPELTGRENIYLNGAILGMTRREISARFDEIVDFAELEKFLDTPVKRYSSGMYVRLAFAVAAHLEPEILVVDEVLAVGDAIFQKKCLGKMTEISTEDKRTLLFVSHNMAAIEALCTQGILIKKGQAKSFKTVRKAVQTYWDELTPSESITGFTRNRESFKSNLIKDAWLEDDSRQKRASFQCGEPFTICMVARGEEIRGKKLVPGFGINDVKGARLASLNGYILGLTPTITQENFLEAFMAINTPPIGPGIYTIDLSLADTPSSMIDFAPNCLNLEILESDFYKSGQLPSRNQGPLLLSADFS